ncbi:MAG: hypothetical protein LBE82_08695 [Chitinophagaceae bacterium]|jgi:hypothetical protein|nr:hypothetical protein [Chitinophagaceae bacterium]
MADKSKTEMTLEVIKVVAMVIGGVWVFYLYRSHGREMQALQVQLANIDTAKGRQEILKGQQEIDRAKQEDTIKTIELKYANSIKESELKALRLQNSGSNIELKYKDLESQLAIQSGKLEIQSKEIDNQLNQLKLKSSLDEKYEYKFDVAIKKEDFKPSDSSVYRVQPQLEITNISGVDLEVSAVIFEFFSNNLNYRHLENSDIFLISTGIPPSIFEEHTAKARLGDKKVSDLPKDDDYYKKIPISPWKKIAYDFSIYSEAESYLLYNDSSILKYYTRFASHLNSVNALGTGVYKPNEKIIVKPTYYIKLVPTQTLCVVVNVIFNRGLKGKRFFYDYYSKSLEEIK